MPTIEELTQNLPQVGRVEWIGLRPGRRQPMIAVQSTVAQPGQGLEGDRYQGRSGGAGKREVTLIQYEHLAAIASLLGRDHIEPADLRRNIAVSGLNLLALKGKQFQIGDAILEYTGLCHPCSRMEETFGPGGYNAVRGHGGINARVISKGKIQLSSNVIMVKLPAVSSE